MSLFSEANARIHKGGAQKYHDANQQTGKLFARDRIALLLDADSFKEDAVFANMLDDSLPADGVVTGTGTIGGRTVCVMANDSTVKAGSWGKRTVEKILRIQETAGKIGAPLFYLVDSAGARITDQIEMFPGRRGAGRIFYNEVRLSGSIPQICLLFGPSAAGGAYIPAFCDVVFMVDKNASMYLGSPRMTEIVINEKTTLEELGGAKMHCEVSGCGDVLCKDEHEAIALAKKYIEYMPVNSRHKPPRAEAKQPIASAKPIATIVPDNERTAFSMHDFIDALIDEGSWFEIKKRFAKEVVTGFARIGGRVVGIVGNQPKHLGGMLLVDSADKAARFIWLCDAFSIPLIFLADVPGFMIGTKVERQGIIRHGAKMISAMSDATVPKICVVVRKAYGAGLYAMCGPAFEPEVTIALPGAKIAVMGSGPAVNAVYYNKIMEKPEAERAAFVEQLRAEYEKDVALEKLAAEMVIDAVVEPQDLRAELVSRLAYAEEKVLPAFPKRRSVLPV